MRTEQTIKHLATSYHNFTVAFEAIFNDNVVTRDNVDSLWIWGESLKRWQEETGVQMHDHDNIGYLISYAKRLLAEKSAPSILEVV